MVSSGGGPAAINVGLFPKPTNRQMMRWLLSSQALPLENDWFNSSGKSGRPCPHIFFFISSAVKSPLVEWRAITFWHLVGAVVSNRGTANAVTYNYFHCLFIFCVPSPEGRPSGVCWCVSVCKGRLWSVGTISVCVGVVLGNECRGLALNMPRVGALVFEEHQKMDVLIASRRGS